MNTILNLREREYEKIIPTLQKMTVSLTELGFKVKSLCLKPSRPNKDDLAPTIKLKVEFKIEKDNKENDLSFYIPELIEGNYFIINGKRKIPQFQIFDIPHVRRNLSLVTNVGSIPLRMKKDDDTVYVSWLSKLVPLALLYFCKYSKEELEQKYQFWTNNIEISKLSEKCQTYFKAFLNNFKNYLSIEKTNFVKELGRYYTNYNIIEKGKLAVYAIDLLPKVDVWIKPFLLYDCILDDILAVLYLDDIDDDSQLHCKRVRFIEYLFASFTKALFNFCCIEFSNNKKTKSKMSFSQTQILNECNSPIIQFDFCMNPVQELTLLSRISPLGPGGFEKGSVPTDYRDINFSMYGKICPVDTPDRENCGVLQNLIPDVDLDKNLRFKKEINKEKLPISIPVQMVPFLEFDDQTRLQMASSQMRQSILLQNLKQPLVQTGNEGKYAPYSWFLQRAKDDGKVFYVDQQLMIVQYKNLGPKVISLGYRTYTEHFNYTKTDLEPEDEFKKGDILTYSPSCKNGKIILGKDILTAIIPWYGYNFEDGIVISDRLVKDDVFTSIHYVDLSFELSSNQVLMSLEDDQYSPLPVVGKVVGKGEPYAIIKKIPNITNVSTIFKEPKELRAKNNLIIIKCEIFPNEEFCKDIPEFRDWVEFTCQLQEKKVQNLKQKFIDAGFSKEQVNKLCDQFIQYKGIKTYKNKREKVDGLYINIEGIYSKKIMVGDKLANRHGNKGVVSKIVPHKKMPKLEDGRHVDICLNPLGVISRMNIGQLFELHLGMAIVDLRRKCKKLLEENNQNEIKKILIKFIDTIDCTAKKEYVKKFKNNLPKEIDLDFIENFCIEIQPFSHMSKERLLKLLDLTNTKSRYKLFDPVSNQEIVNKIAVGYMHIFKLLHMSECKLAARSIGPYAKKTLQPLSGRKNQGAQRCGEMECVSLIAHGALNNLYEFITTKSDSIDLKNNFLRKTISNFADVEDSSINVEPESVYLLNSYLKLIGVDSK